MSSWLRCDIQQVTPTQWRAYIREHGITVVATSSKDVMANTVEMIERLTGEPNPQIVWLESLAYFTSALILSGSSPCQCEPSGATTTGAAL